MCHGPDFIAKAVQERIAAVGPQTVDIEPGRPYENGSCESFDARLHTLAHGADVQDRDGGVFVMATLFGLYPFLLKPYADGGYQRPRFLAGLRCACRRV